MTVTINTAEALALLEQAVPTKGADHYQQECYYVEREEGDYESPEEGQTPWKPGCLVGTVLWNLMGSDEAIETLSQYGVNGDLFTNIYDTLPGLDFTDGGVAVLNIAQEAQDGRGIWEEGGKRTWGQALDAAKEFAKGLD